jgi:hypothetical protein
MLILNSLSNKRKFTLMWNFRAAPSLQEEWDVYVFKLKAQNTAGFILLHVLNMSLSRFYSMYIMEFPGIF